MSKPHAEIRASNLYRRRNCPASYRLEADLPDEKSEDATEGDMLHKCLATGSRPADLKLDQEACLEFCIKTVGELKDRFFQGRKTTDHVEAELNFGEFRKGFGHADLVSVCGPIAMVVDYKFGRIPVDASDANDQLRAYAVMVADEYLVKTVYAVIVQPRAPGDARVTISEYGAAAIAASRDEIFQTIDICETRNLPPTAGDWCQYCRARATCPALQQQASELTIIDTAAIMPGNAADIYRRCKLVEKHLNALKARIFLTVNNAASQNIPTPGIVIKAGKKLRSITDAQAAFSAVQSVLSPDEFITAAKVSVADLEEVYVKKLKLLATGGEKITIKSGKEKLAAALGDVLTVKQSEGSLELVDDKGEE